MNVYIRPRTSVNETTLQASADTWRDVLSLLRTKGMARYSIFIEPHLRPEQRGTVEITFPNETAQQLIRMLGYSA